MDNIFGLFYFRGKKRELAASPVSNVETQVKKAKTEVEQVPTPAAKATPKR